MGDARDFDLHAGTTALYLDPTYYDYEYRSRTADVRWYVERYLEVEAPVLELGVGTGRIALRAVREGATVTGVDLSPTMLAQATARRESLPRGKRERLELLEGDMRSVALGRRFGLVSCPFNAFQHLYTRDDVERCLAVVRDHLEPGGVFAFDVLMPDLEYLNRPAFKTFAGVRFKHPTYGCHFTYAEQTAFDVVSQLNQMRFVYERTDPSEAGPPSYAVELTHRYFFPRELESLLHYNGFRVLCTFGDFEQGELRHDSESQVLLCELR
jgi:SAM-dependent methyltransferase